MSWCPGPPFRGLAQEASCLGQGSAMGGVRLWSLETGSSGGSRCAGSRGPTGGHVQCGQLRCLALVLDSLGTGRVMLACPVSVSLESSSASSPCSLQVWFVSSVRYAGGPSLLASVDAPVRTVGAGAILRWLSRFGTQRFAWPHRSLKCSPSRGHRGLAAFPAVGPCPHTTCPLSDDSVGNSGASKAGNRW